MKPNQSQFSGTHHHIYEMLRSYLMQLHGQGVPGLDEVINALNKAHVKQLGQPQQAPTMPAQMTRNQLPIMPSTQQTMPNPQMPQQGGF